MEKAITTDTIISWIQEKIENKEALPPSLFLDAAIKLNVLLSNEHDKEAELFQKVAAYKAVLINQGSTVAKANVLSQASQEFLELRKQHAKIEIIVEFIRLSKIQAKLRFDELKGY